MKKAIATQALYVRLESSLCEWVHAQADKVGCSITKIVGDLIKAKIEEEASNV